MDLNETRLFLFISTIFLCLIGVAYYFQRIDLIRFKDELMVFCDEKNLDCDELGQTFFSTQLSAYDE